MIARLLIALLRGYKKYISPHLGHHCRFIPTCSEYAFEAIEKYGAVKGGWLAVKRLSRCHPLHFGEHEFYDPVPYPPRANCPERKPWDNSPRS